MQPRALPNRWTSTLIAAVLVVGAATAASAQQKPSEKKLYCWDEGGRRICSDALPASAVGRQRTEFDLPLDFSEGTGERELQIEKKIFSLSGDVTDLLQPAKPFVFGMNKN